MSNFPVTISDETYSSPKQLRQAFEERVQYGITDHPGQSTPADHYLDAIRRDRSGKVQRALRDALQLTLETSRDDTELWLAVQICGMNCPPAFYRTLVKRLDGGGVGEPARSSFMVALTQGTAIGDAALTGHIRDWLRKQGELDMLIDTLIGNAPTSELLEETLNALKAGALDSYKPSTVGIWLARGEDWDGVIRLAEAIADENRGVRTRYLDGLQSVAKGWLKVHKGRLTKALALD